MWGTTGRSRKIGVWGLGKKKDPSVKFGFGGQVCGKAKIFMFCQRKALPIKSFFRFTLGPIHQF